jgi:hypothetical protein
MATSTFFGDDLPLLGATGGTVTGAWTQWYGGTGRFMASSTGWNGAQLSLQYQGPGGATDPIDAGTDTTLTANGGGLFTLPPCLIRCAVSVAVPSANAFANATLVRAS